jgi:hypothetical protein
MASQDYSAGSSPERAAERPRISHTGSRRSIGREGRSDAYAARGFLAVVGAAKPHERRRRW